MLGRWMVGVVASCTLVLGACTSGQLERREGEGDGDDGGVELMRDATPEDDAGGGEDAGGGGDEDAGGGGDDAGGGGQDAGSGGEDAGGDKCADGPLEEPIPGCSPTPAPASSDPYQDCVDRINQFRWECQCLPPLERWEEGEDCADMHAEYDSDNGAHAGFRDGICSPGGSAQNECPAWGSIRQTITGCLQAMWDEGPGEPFSEHGHYINMSNTSFSRVACGFYEDPDGGVWAVQNFQ